MSIDWDYEQSRCWFPLKTEREVTVMTDGRREPVEALIARWRKSADEHEKRADAAETAMDQTNVDRQDAYAYAARLHADQLEACLRSALPSEPPTNSEVWDAYELAVYGKVGNTFETERAQRIQRFFDWLRSAVLSERIRQEREPKNDARGDKGTLSEATGSTAKISEGDK